MPIHDWTRVDANLFHDFHQAWSVTISNALNNGILPKRCSALVERHDPTVSPDVLSSDGRACLAACGNRIAIRRALRKTVSVIEIVSPGNKDSVAALNSFIAKTIEFINNGVNVMVIDLFPPTKHDPLGIHKLIWDEVEIAPYGLPQDKPLTLVSYVVDDPMTARVELLTVGDPLPDMPAYLDADSYVPVPLETTYQTTWDSCPEDMREAVVTGRLPD